MRLKCACGREFEAPDGAQSAKCPACGKTVRAAQSQDWLQNVEIDGLSLEEEAPKPEEPAAAAPAGGAAQKAGGPAPGAAAPAEGGQRPPVVRGSAQAAGAASRRQTTLSAPKAPKYGPPNSVVDLLKVLADEPAEAAPLLRDGVTSQRFMVELGTGVVIVGLIGALLLAWLCYPATFDFGLGIRLWLKLLCETVAAAIMLSLIAVGLKRECKPLGVVQGVVFARIISLGILLPLGILLGVISAILLSRSGDFPSGMLWVNRMMLKLYVLTVMVVQGGVTTGLFKLGCGGSIVLSIVAVYGGAYMAKTIFGAAPF